MRRCRVLPTASAVALLALLGWHGLAAAADPTPEAREFFEKKIRPVLVEHCYSCHSQQAKKVRGGLHLDSREAILRGGDTGPALVPGNPGKSRLIEAVAYRNTDLQMPPKTKLPAALIADLAAWVQMGAPWPKDGAKIVGATDGFDLQGRKREHWAWQPVRPPAPPPVQDGRELLGPLDRFLRARLEEKGLTPAGSADRRTLLRRLAFDLTGLPPAPAEVAAFVADRSPDAYARQVERYLASPHFGERWARHWLDLVRYAESRGHEFDYTNPNAWQYRDYVLRAFNADVPYNQFVTEHVAGDLLPRPRLHPIEGFNESVLGTGFWFLGEQVHSPVDICQDKADRFDNMLDVFGKTFLGLTVACARCHDHKFDALAAKDYYALCGFLESSSYRLVRFDSIEHNRRVAADLWRTRARGRAAVQKAVAGSMQPVLDRLDDYLLAAREAGAANADAVARRRGLDPELLRRWVTHLASAARDANDPLHAWARVASDATSARAGRVAEALRPLVEGWRRREADADTALTGTEVVIDYGAPSREGWIQDGFAFGPGPVRPGEVRLDTNPARPIARVFTRAAAEKDPAWDGLKLAPGTETDPGSLGKVVRSGRTLRTPTFEVRAGKVFSLVRGTGQIFAAVDHHVMIAGPLHGRVLQTVQTGPAFQWVEHDLTRYSGRRVHLEFTPIGTADFAVALVVQGERTPGSSERPSGALLSLLASDSVMSLEALAAGYQKLLARVAERFGADRLVGSADAVEQARLADWLVRHQELFLAGGAGKTVAAAAGPVLAEQARLVGRIRTESRLALALLDGSGVNEHVYLRGSYKTPGEVAPRRFLEALAGPEPLRTTRGSGRLELARQLTDPTRNPLVARVIVNRVWHHLFGRGIVASVDNFGVLGEPPTHPGLLDRLADTFVRDGWSLKRLVRRIVLSRAYRMASRGDERAAQADPQNLLLHRQNVRRLEGETIRDAMLAVSGRLDRRPFGPPVPVHLTDFQQGRGRPQSGPLDGAGRRSLYLSVRRNFLPALLLAFDTPAPFSTVGRRTVSNVPAQALILLNDPFVHQQAGLWARRVLAAPGTSADRVERMYLSAFGRPPDAEELRACLEFLGRPPQPAGAARNEQAAWADLAHVLFNAKEFIYLP